MYIDKVKSNFVRDRDVKATDHIEIKSLIGIFLLAGVMKSSRRNTTKMWDNSRGTGVELSLCYNESTKISFLTTVFAF